ncbi:VOC family protein [Streptomyces sp. HUAS MG47]|uniref:VOC family protein n=1 Tax=Streptomyces solicamelliae TaxID=3231716 RepID=UPI003877BC9E
MAVFAEGTPCWVDVQLPDLEAGKRFYGELFGWTFDPATGEARVDGRRAAGLVPKRDGRMPTTWTVYLATADAGVLARRIKAAGGRMVMEPYPVGPYGVVALAADPGGAVFGLRQGGERDDGFQTHMEPGSFCWMEVYTREKDAVDTFYAAVFGYVAQDLAEGGLDYRVWSPPGSRPGDDSSFGGRALITDAFPAEMPGHVLVYFAVEDTDAACAATVRMGGRITNEPFDTPHGRIAVLTDNQGARFGVLAEPTGGKPAKRETPEKREPQESPEPQESRQEKAEPPEKSAPGAEEGTESGGDAAAKPDSGTPAPAEAAKTAEKSAEKPDDMT